MSLYSEHYEENLFEEAENSADDFWAEQPFCLEDILAEFAEKDAESIRNGATINETARTRHSYLEKITEDPLLYCYHAGQKFWDFYCKLLRDFMGTTDRAKLAIFPEW